MHHRGEFLHAQVCNCNTIKLNRVLQAITCSFHIILKTNLVRLKSFIVILMLKFMKQTSKVYT